MPPSEWSGGSGRGSSCPDLPANVRYEGRICADRSGPAPEMNLSQEQTERRHRRSPLFEWTASECPQNAQKNSVVSLREDRRGSTCVMREP